MLFYELSIVLFEWQNRNEILNDVGSRRGLSLDLVPSTTRSAAVDASLEDDKARAWWRERRIGATKTFCVNFMCHASPAPLICKTLDVIDIRYDIDFLFGFFAIRTAHSPLELDSNSTLKICFILFFSLSRFFSCSFRISIARFLSSSGIVFSRSKPIMWHKFWF